MSPALTAGFFTTSVTWLKQFMESVQSLQSLRRSQLFATLWVAACQAFPSITNSRSLLNVHRVSDANQPSQPLSSPSPPAFPSIRVFFNESVLCIRWPKYWSFSLSISPSKECSRLISFRTDWFDLSDQGTFKSLPQHHILKASILWSSAFFMVLHYLKSGS